MDLPLKRNNEIITTQMIPSRMPTDLKPVVLAINARVGAERVAGDEATGGDGAGWAWDRGWGRLSEGRCC